MKKLAIALALVLSLSLFAACGSSASSGSPASGSSSQSNSQTASMPANLNDVMDKLYDGVNPEELPMLADADTINEMYPETQQEGDRYRRVTEETSEYDVGVARDSYKEALISESMMGTAYTVALLRAESADAAAKLAEDVKANVDPRKWICVEADHVVVEQIEDVVLLAMYTQDTASAGDKIVANFKSMAQ